MLRIRMVTAGAVLVMAVSAAAAQTDTEPGKPMSILQILLAPAKAKIGPQAATPKARPARTHRRFVGRHVHRAARRDHPAHPAEESATETTATAPVNVLPTIDADAFTTAMAAPAPQPALVQDAAVPTADSRASDMTVEHGAVPTAAPDTAASTRPAANDPNAAPPAQNAPADPQSAAAEIAMFAQQNGGDNSRDAWFEELLAMLGGALAASSVAWFLIGAAPQRTYG